MNPRHTYIEQKTREGKQGKGGGLRKATVLDNLARAHGRKPKAKSQKLLFGLSSISFDLPYSIYTCYSFSPRLPLILTSLQISTRVHLQPSDRGFKASSKMYFTYILRSSYNLTLRYFSSRSCFTKSSLL